MEYRKLISFGKSSYVVTLPKTWVQQNKLNSGDLVYFDQTPEGLTLSPRPENSEEEKEITILVDGKSKSQIRRELIPAYVNNYKTIILMGKELKTKAEEIEPIIQNLMALEIMEQTSDKIIARDFLNMKDLSVPNLLRKMDVIVRSMLVDCLVVFQEKGYENISLRDKDVNRLSYLIYRAVLYGLKNQGFMSKQFKLQAQDLLRYHILVMHIEVIGDEVRRLARYMQQIQLPKAKQQQFVELTKRAQESYNDTMKAIYTNNVTLAQAISEKKNALIKDAEEFYLQNRNVNWVAYMVDRLKRMISTINKMGRLVDQETKAVGG